MPPWALVHDAHACKTSDVGAMADASAPEQLQISPNTTGDPVDAPAGWSMAPVQPSNPLAKAITARSRTPNQAPRT